MYDDNDDITDGGENSTIAVKHVYSVELHRLVWHETVLDITTMMASSKATVSIELPHMV